MATPPVTDLQIRNALAAPIKAVSGCNGDEFSPKVYIWNPIKPMGEGEREKIRSISEWEGIFSYTKPNTKQQISNTAQGSITGNGSLVIQVTSALLPLGQKIINVPVTTIQSLSDVADSIQLALNSDLDISAKMDASNDGPKIELLINQSNAGANDPTFNLSLLHGTATGLTDSPTSIVEVEGLDNSEIQKVHGWMIKRTIRDSDIMAGPGCETFHWDYDVWFFYGFRMGTESSNSEIEFNQYVDQVCEQINSSSLLDVNGKSIQHFGIKFPLLSLLKSGEGAMHFGGANIRFQFGD